MSFKNLKNIQNSPKRVLGQGMTEYIIIVALIAISAIGVFTFFGDTARNQVAGMAMELSGQQATNEIAAAGADATAATQQGVADKSLDSYDSNVY
jgi:Tfp pilus assembly major pilin PilA